MMRLIATVWLLAYILTGCGGKDNQICNSPSIEDYSWQMITVQSMEAEGQTIACVPGNDGTSDNAVEILLDCTAADGTIILFDEMKRQTYSGTYKLIETDELTSTYEVTIDDTEGMAVVSTTTYRDERQTPTFIICLGNFTLNFFPVTE